MIWLINFIQFILWWFLVIFYIEQIVTFVCSESAAIICLTFVPQETVNNLIQPLGNQLIDQSINLFIVCFIKMIQHPAWLPPDPPWNVNQLDPFIVTPSTTIPSTMILSINKKIIYCNTLHVSIECDVLPGSINHEALHESIQKSVTDHQSIDCYMSCFNSLYCYF